MQGLVKWFKQDKGFGFITGEDGVEYFVHFADIQSQGRNYLMQGERVEFEPGQGPKGPKAVNVKTLG
jgi:CspA family cold shock protein